MSKKTESYIKFRRISDEDKETLKRWSESNGKTWETALRKVLNRVHESKPKVIFLTQTSSIPYGFALKEAYKHAYPDEPQPKFLTIDVKPARKLGSDFDGMNRLYEKHVPKGFIYDIPFNELRKVDENRAPKNWEDTNIYHEKQKEVERKVEEDLKKKIDEASSAIIEKTKEKLRKYGVKDEDSILLMDEHIGDNEEHSISNVIKKIKTGKFYKRTTGIAYQIIKDASSSISPHIKVDFDFIFGSRLSSQDYGSFGPWIGPKVSNYSNEEERLHPTRRYQGKEERDISRENMTYLKGLGKKVGDEIAQERKKKKDLEQHLSAIIGIGGLIASLFFLSPKLTGNVIGISKTSSNLTGIILFISGLTGLFIYLKRKN